MTDQIFETPEILSDQPLQSEDQAHFHFDEFAITLARLIASKQTRTPLTIGVSGAWGSGKTTLLRRVQKMLNQTQVFNIPTKPDLLEFVNPHEDPAESFRVCRTVWFNAWKYADEDELLVALVRVIVQAMAQDDVVSKVLGKMMDPSYPRRDVINTVLSWFSIKIEGVEAGLNTGDPVETPFAEKTATLDLFDQAFERLMAAWVHRKMDVRKINPDTGVLVVFIDDLDRCLPAKTVQVLEAIKLFLDKNGCIFVLGADTRLIQDAVHKYYADAGITGEQSRDYLEKIIQLRFELPPIPVETMGRFLSEVPGSDETLQGYWQVLVAGAEVNPRKVKTFLNDLNLAWAMLTNSGQAGNVDRVDFIRWQVLMRAAPENFRRRVKEIDDQDLTFKFVQDALLWEKGQGDETLESTFRDYERSRRLRRVLKAIDTFGDGFNPETLNAFLHLAAPPTPEETGGQIKEVVPELSGEVKGLERPQPDRPTVQRTGLQTYAGIEFVPVPAGKFLMGSREDDSMADTGEQPQHTVDITYDFYIARTPVTNAQYARYAQAEGISFEIPPDKEDHPVVNINWHEARAYCEWLNNTRSKEISEGTTYRLATEAEWEKAARGEYGNTWPWGNEWDPKRCNSSESGRGGTTPVGVYSPQGDSPYGAADMAGNVWEWTQSLYRDYPYEPGDGLEDPEASGFRVFRGGSFFSKSTGARAACRNGSRPDNQRNYIGFRVVVAPHLF